MIDIAPKVKLFLEGKTAGWPRERSVEVASAIARELAQKLSWDDGAGEDWGRVLWGESAGIMISMTGPLIIMTPEEGLRVAVIAGEIPIVEVSSLDVPLLTCNTAVLNEAFGDQGSTNSDLDAMHFSADELWFWTV